MTRDFNCKCGSLLKEGDGEMCVGCEGDETVFACCAGLVRTDATMAKEDMYVTKEDLNMDEFKCLYDYPEIQEDPCDYMDNSVLKKDCPCWREVIIDKRVKPRRAGDEQY